MIQDTGAWPRARYVLRRLRYWLLDAPADERRRRFRRAIAGAARKVGLSVAKPQAVEAVAEAEAGGYDVICLPVIPWSFRFQRPQQLMRQWAARGHRVFYAALTFHDGTEAKLSPVCGAGVPPEPQDVLPGVAEMTLPGTPGMNVYGQLPIEADVNRMAAAIDRLRRQRRIAAAVVVVQLPFWSALAEKLRERFGWPVVYDCMDDHSGFSTNSTAMLRAEDRTIAAADLVVVTSEVLHEKIEPRARRIALVRNGCDYEHFASVSSPLSKGEGTAFRNPTVGFYGAIAEWFDADLVADLAQLRPGWKFELIGSTYTGDVSRLAKLPNVALLGEKPYAELPRLMARWHCCIIPFKRLPLTEATNPVKAYEMLAAGKPLVAADLPELRPMARDGLLTLADDAHGFAAAVEAAVAADGAAGRERRRAFAAANRWQDRCDAFDRAVRELFPPASIIVVTYNNLALNKDCLQSIFRETEWPNCEVIVVDNASQDGTAEWLAEVEKGDSPLLPDAPVETVPCCRPRLRVIRNVENRGFSAANNQGLRLARGEFLCLLNNDTLVTRGWLTTLIGHLRQMPGVGLVGPVSNQISNEAKVPVDYATPADMPRWAEAYCRAHDGETFFIPMLAFFCVVFRRETYEEVGDLDERFGIGCFEDDDYCRRVQRRGYQLRCARDAFVHHRQRASFQLIGEDRYLGIYHENKRRFEAKWAAEEMVGTHD